MTKPNSKVNADEARKTKCSSPKTSDNSWELEPLLQVDVEQGDADVGSAAPSSCCSREPPCSKAAPLLLHKDEDGHRRSDKSRKNRRSSRAKSNDTFSFRVGGKIKHQVQLSWQDVTVRPRKGDCCSDLLNCDVMSREVSSRPVLENQTGYVLPKQTLAILGATGSGKSTLLNTLTMSNLEGLRVVSGKVFLNGNRANTDHLAEMSVYVKQDDLFVGVLTVREHLRLQARLRIGFKMPNIERLAEVEFLIDQLGLSGCADVRIGDPLEGDGISGGERKRLSLATEVLSNPSIVFCDEPTTGLDSAMAHGVVKVLKTLSKQGRTVIFTIHQPSSEVYDVIDRILLLAKGKMAFQGKKKHALEFFKRIGFPVPAYYNPADHYLAMLAANKITNDGQRTYQKICNQFEESKEGDRVVKFVEEIRGHRMVCHFADSFAYNASYWDQMIVLIYRNVLTVAREPMICRARMMQNVFIALLLGAIYFPQDKELGQASVMNINGAIFIFLVNISFANVYLVIHVFCSEMGLFLREYSSCLYRASAYYLSKQIAELPMFLLNTVIFGSIFYWMVGLYSGENFSERFLTFIAIGCLVTLVVLGFGYMVSCLSGTLPVAMAVNPALTAPLFLYAGYFVNQDTMQSWLVWIKYISWFFYGMELLMVNQWQGIEITCDNRNITGSSRCFETGEAVLDFFKYNPDFFYRDIGLLLLLVIVFRLIGIIALQRRALNSARRTNTFL